MSRKPIYLVALTLTFGVVLAGCGGDAGPTAGFDVTGMWSEQGGDSTLTFTDTSELAVEFGPWLSDDTASLNGVSYDRVDNAHLSFTVVLGRNLSIVDVGASIDSNEVVSFTLDGRTFKFEKLAG